jgi:DNA-binding MarR family transcriptional regulator
MREPSTSFLRVTNKIARMAKSPADFGTGDLLYFSEIQIIDVVGNHPEVNITELSNILGITKGTASPVVNRLTRRGYLKKLRARGDGRVIYLQLTEKGQVAWKGLEKQAKEYALEYTKVITSGEWAIFNDVITKLEAFVDNKMKIGA